MNGAIHQTGPNRLAAAAFGGIVSGSLFGGGNGGNGGAGNGNGTGGRVRLCRGPKSLKEVAKGPSLHVLETHGA